MTFVNGSLFVNGSPNEDSQSRISENLKGSETADAKKKSDESINQELTHIAPVRSSTIQTKQVNTADTHEGNCADKNRIKKAFGSSKNEHNVILSSPLNIVKAMDEAAKIIFPDNENLQKNEGISKKKLIAIDKIAQHIFAIYPNLNRQELYESIKSDVLKVSKDNPDQRINLSLNGITDKHYISVFNNMHGKILVIANATTMIAKGGYGTLYRVETLHDKVTSTHDTDETLQYQDVKVPDLAVKVPHENEPVASIDLINESKIRKELAGSSGLQEPTFAAVEDLSYSLLAKGNLWDFMKSESYKNLSNSKKVTIANEMISYVLAMHEKGIFHGDLKPSNILFYQEDTGNIKFKICDFGGAYLFEEAFQTFPVDYREVYHGNTHAYFSLICFKRVDAIIFKTNEYMKLNGLKSDNKTDEIIQNAKKEIIQLLKEQDSFAIGKTAIEFITNQECSGEIVDNKFVLEEADVDKVVVALNKHNLNEGDINQLMSLIKKDPMISVNKKGMTPLHLDAINGSVVNLEKKANENPKIFWEAMNLCDTESYTPILRAFIEWKPDVIRFLHENYKNELIESISVGDISFLIARSSRYNDMEMFNLLMEIVPNKFWMAIGIDEYAQKLIKATCGDGAQKIVKILSTLQRRIQ